MAKTANGQAVKDAAARMQEEANKLAEAEADALVVTAAEAVAEAEASKDAPAGESGESVKTDGAAVVKTDDQPTTDPVAEVVKLAEDRASVAGEIAALNARQDTILGVIADRTADKSARLSAMDDLDGVTAELETRQKSSADIDAQIAARAESVTAALTTLRDGIGASAQEVITLAQSMIADSAATLDALGMGERLIGLISRARHFNSLATLTGQDGMIIGSVIASPFRKSATTSGTGSTGSTGNGSTTFTETDNGGISFPLRPNVWQALGEYLPDSAYHTVTYSGHKDARRYSLNAAQRAEVVKALAQAATVLRDDAKLAQIKVWLPRLNGDATRAAAAEAANVKTDSPTPDATPDTSGESGEQTK